MFYDPCCAGGAAARPVKTKSRCFERRCISHAAAFKTAALLGGPPLGQDVILDDLSLPRQDWRQDHMANYMIEK
jgi:hypothetical protein